MADVTEAFAAPGSHSIIDAIHPITGRGLYSNETLDQISIRYPGAEVVNLESWCAAKGEAQNSLVVWDEISEEQYDNWLECLPPAAMTRTGFLVGEPSDHHAVTGKARFQACIQKDGKHYASSRPMTRAEFNALP